MVWYSKEEVDFDYLPETDIGSYTSHSGVADAYPSYLTKILNTLKDL